MTHSPTWWRLPHSFDDHLVCERCHLTQEATYNIGRQDQCWQRPWENNAGLPPRYPERILARLDLPTLSHKAR